MSNIHTIMLTLTVALAVGTVMLALADRLRIPMMVPLLASGILLGPYGLGLLNPNALGSGLSLVIKLAVAIILFDGALNLDPKGFKEVPIIRRLLSVGVLVTWLGATLIVWLVAGEPITIALLAGSLVIVTGPTVIAPLLRRVRVLPRLHHILHWESVLIDPIGVFIAVLLFELITPATSGAVSIVEFFLRIPLGIIMGTVTGLGLDWTIRRTWLADERVDLLVLGGVLLTFGLSDTLLAESGLLTVVVAGFILGFRNAPRLQRIREFKLQLTDLGIVLVFMLLAARLNVTAFVDYSKVGIFVTVGVLLLRPVTIAISTRGSGMPWRERAFLSFVCPRGIVAASMASLFSLRLVEAGQPDGAFLELFTYGVIAVTVLVQAPLTKPVALMLKVASPARKGWLIMGAHTLGRTLAHFIEEHSKCRVVLIDTNVHHVEAARAEGLSVILGSALELRDDENLSDIGFAFAATDNTPLNALAAGHFQAKLGLTRIYGWKNEKKAVSPHIGAVYQPVTMMSPSELSSDLDHGIASLKVRRKEDMGPEMPSTEPFAVVLPNGEVALGDNAKNVKDAKVVLVLSNSGWVKKPMACVTHSCE